MYNGVNEEPSFLKPLLQDSLIDAMVWYISPDDVAFFIPWRFADMASKQYGVPIMGTTTKIAMIDDVCLKITASMKKIWLCGRISYKEYQQIQNYAPNATIVSLDYEILPLYAPKTIIQKHNIRDIQALTQKIFHAIRIRPWMTEKDIEKQFLDNIPDWYAKQFLCITGFDNLRDSTIASATDRVINEWEVLCVDFGLYGNGVHSDMTRCFFVWDDAYWLRDWYHRIQSVITESLQSIIPWKHNKEFVQDFIALSEKYWLTEYYLTDLGHGIGCDLHEYPDLYNDDFIFEEGMCFTLEPEYKVNWYLLRYEDIYTIHQGKTVLLQSIQ